MAPRQYDVALDGRFLSNMVLGRCGHVTDHAADEWHPEAKR